MTPIKRVLVGLLLGLTVLWGLADSLFPDPLTYFTFREVFVQFSGVLAVGAMSVSLVLALRLEWLEAPLEGLDKAYRLHKWLGITALVSGTAHWWFAKGTKWMVGWGWLEKPARGPRTEETLGLVEGWFREQRGLAETVGEWAFYAAAVLIVLALVKRFPYHWFQKTHKLLAVAYLVLAFHSVVLVEFDYWLQPVGWVVGMLMAAGTLSAVLVLLGRVGASRAVTGEVESLTFYPQLRVLETSIRLQPGWAGHRAGQFAFVTVPGEGAHPYTIASAWQPDTRRMTFITKALGDHTSRLRELLREGMTLRVEGPYGCFDFTDAQPRQVWVGAGIGITPFVARMKQLAAQGGSEQVIDLFHTTRDVEQAALDKLRADAEAAGVQLHIRISGQDSRLDGAAIRESVPEWRDASVWFCGPSGFGQSLHSDFTREGLPRGRFHQELFEMR